MTALQSAQSIQDFSAEVAAFERDAPGAAQGELSLAAYGIGPAEVALLDELGALIGPKLDAILEGFYKGIVVSPELNTFFSNDAMYAHAKRKQKAHWQGMMRSNIHDGAYATSCEIIGATHFRIGLPFEHYMAAYARIGSELQRIILRSKRGFWRRNAAKNARLLDVMSRMVVMDMERAISAFFRAQRAAELENLLGLSETLENDVGTVVEGVSAAAVELSATAGTMVTSGQSAQSEASNARRLADDMAGHVQGVASAVEELSASITQISDQLTESSTLSNKANQGAEQAGATVQDLDKAVGDIGTVLEMISSIAKQTNLLALNATVEAARSGEAGRGFAVVALEIKNLSERISEATREINTRISNIRSRTSDVVTDTVAIRDAISSLDATNAAIAAAVAEQKQATQDIANSAEVTAGRTSQMADAMKVVDTVVTDIASASRHVSEAADVMQSQAAQLQSSTAQFAQNMATRS